MTTVECMLCSDTVEAGPVLGSIDGGLPTPTRSFVQGGEALLHHRCAAASTRDMIEGDQWFYCERPTEPVGVDTLFDVNCSTCRQVWDDVGRSFWAST